MANEQDYVDLGLYCADICRALDRGMGGKRLEVLSQPVCEAINQLTMWAERVVYSLDSLLTKRLLTGPLRRFRGRSSNKVGATTFPDFSTQEMIRIRLLLGSWN
jgi:hypothetical protein